MSGAKLSIIEDQNSQNNKSQIHIGNTNFVKSKNLLPTDLPINGYRIITINDNKINNLIITAKNSLGISHGICDLLTNELGVMWGMADPIFEEIPDRRTITVDEIDRIEKPTFGFRVFSVCEPNWIRRNRIDNGSRELPFYGHGHNLYNVIPLSKYADHPEFYALVDGDRKVPEKDGHTPIQPCLTNPDVIRITIETVRDFFDQNPNVSTYSLCPNDSSIFCECNNCLDLDNTIKRYRDRRMNSNSYFNYIDTVAKSLIKTHPNRYVSAYAYWTTELPPQQIDHLTSNVVIYLTQDSSQYYDREYENRDREILEIWSKVADHLAIYDYWASP